MKIVMYCCLHCKVDGVVRFPKTDKDDDEVDVHFCPNCGEKTFDDGLYDVEDEE